MTSASERLRALGEDNRDPALKIGAALLVMDALPLIADVVEAAETGPDRELVGYGITEPIQWNPRWPELHAALIALRDALEEK